jgi:polysaccharide deacetylase family protein (PEP-CTERM system associated)
MEMKHFLLTIDVEDWFQVENLRPWYPRESWSSQQIRVEESTGKILALLDKVSAGRETPVKATFFILAWIARKLPRLVREISAAGHEVASHGYSHQLCVDQSESELRSDLEKSKKILEDTIGSQVFGYRAPSFSISQRILEMIREAGYTYDASYNSFGMNSRYGRLNVGKYKKRGIALDLGDGFYELPLTNVCLWGKYFPCSGGGFFRLLPGPLFRMGVQRILSSQDAYHFYMHPWETDPDQPRQQQASFLSKFRHYVNLKKTLPKLESLVRSFDHCRFSTCIEYLRTFSKNDSNVIQSAMGVEQPAPHS